MEFAPFPQLESQERALRLRHGAVEVQAAPDIVPFPGMPFSQASGEPGGPWAGVAAVWAKPRPDAVHAIRSRVPIGIRAVDEFLGGGLPGGSTVAVVGPPFGGKRSLACQFLAAGVAAGAPSLAVHTDGDVTQWRQAVASLCLRVPEERKGAACFLDLGAPEATAEMPLPEAAVRAVANACEALPSDRRRVVFDSFSTVTALCGFAAAFSMLARLTADLRREGATTLILAEAGAHTPMEIQLVKRQADGAFEFRQYGGLPEVQVTGLGLASPSPWLQCRADGSPVQVASRA